MSVDILIQDVLEREGGFVDHPADRGGPTNFGITQATLAAWYRRPVSPQDVEKLTRAEAAAIYRGRYYHDPRIDKLPALIRPLLFDMAVNHGPGQAVIMLQQVLNAEGGWPKLAEDGKIGRITAHAAEQAVSLLRSWLIIALIERRRRFYLSIIADDPSQAVFEKGWLARLAWFVPTAEQLRAGG